MSDTKKCCPKHIGHIKHINDIRPPSYILGKMVGYNCLDCVNQYISFCEKEGIIIKSLTNKKGWTPIHHAIFVEQIDIFKSLISFCSLKDLTQKAPISGNTLLHSASENENSKFLEILLGLILEKKLTLNMFKNSSGYSPLHSAVYLNKRKNIELLLKFKFSDGFQFDINGVDIYGNSILHLAVKSCFIYGENLLEFLIEDLNQDGTYLDLNIRNRDGKTALDVAYKKDDIEYLTKVSSLTKTKSAKKALI